MSQLKVRITSAVVAVVILLTVLYFFKEQGLYYICIFAVGRAAYEVARMLSFKDFPNFFKINFFIVSFGSFLLINKIENAHYAHYVSSMIFMWIVIQAVIFHKKFEDINAILKFIALFFLGVFYISFLPLNILWLLQMDRGSYWFFTLLAVVFSGDIGAYIFGSLWGKTKIAPTLSPKKSLEGSFGGVLFSLALALICRHFFFAEQPIWIFAIIGIFGGILGQIGDFFESLLKRIAGVKDSGRIMPGHGGALDRIDGVLFAGPLFYLATYFITKV